LAGLSTGFSAGDAEAIAPADLDVQFQAARQGVVQAVLQIGEAGGDVPVRAAPISRV
jgi:hypothetical protein